MLSCKEVSELVSQSLDRRLSLRERLGVRLHLLMCGMCRRYREQITFLSQASRKLLGRGAPGASLPAAARRRIEQALKAQRKEKG